WYMRGRVFLLDFRQGTVMRANRCGAGGRRLFLFVLAMLAWAPALSQAQPPEKMPRADEPGALLATPKKPQPTIAFAMDKKPWPQVIEWLTDQTGLPVITTYNPTGTFTFTPPKGQKYTIPEVIDILNSALEPQKYLIIKRDSSFRIVLAENKVDPSLLPHIRAEELDEHGNTEMVSVTIPLNALEAEDMLPEVKAMIGPFGSASALPNSNALLIEDIVSNLKRIVKTLRETEEQNKGGSETYIYRCEHIRARDAERQLKEQLGDPERMFR